MQNASIFVTFYKFDKCVFFCCCKFYWINIQRILSRIISDARRFSLCFFFTIIWPKTFCTSRWHFAIFKYKNTHGFTFVYCHQKNFFFYVFIAFKGKWCSSMFFHLFLFFFCFFVFCFFAIHDSFDAAVAGWMYHGTISVIIDPGRLLRV